MFHFSQTSVANYDPKVFHPRLITGLCEANSARVEIVIDFRQAKLARDERCHIYMLMVSATVHDHVCKPDVESTDM